LSRNRKGGEGITDKYQDILLAGGGIFREFGKAIVFVFLNEG
jgi:hypothetical protein